jgi:ferredoxin
MGRQLNVTPDAVAAAERYLSPEFALQRLAITEWKDRLLNGYFAIIGAAFVAREIRNLIERRRDNLVAISYPTRTVHVPRGWSVLEASRSFHLPHASMCGGRARCSTCRVRVTAGEKNIPPPELDEKGTLERINAPPDVRLACQLRPEGDVGVVPLVQTERPIYRQNLPQRVRMERDIVVLFCDTRNREELAADNLPHDQLYVLTLFAEAISHAIRSAGGTLSYIEFDTICALFGTEGRTEVCAQRALQAAGAIEGVIADLNKRLVGPSGDDRDRRRRRRGQRAAQICGGSRQSIRNLGAGVRGSRHRAGVPGQGCAGLARSRCRRRGIPVGRCPDPLAGVDAARRAGSARQAGSALGTMSAPVSARRSGRGTRRRRPARRR